MIWAGAHPWTLFIHGLLSTPQLASGELLVKTQVCVWIFHAHFSGDFVSELMPSFLVEIKEFCSEQQRSCINHCSECKGCFVFRSSCLGTLRCEINLQPISHLCRKVRVLPVGLPWARQGVSCVHLGITQPPLVFCNKNALPVPFLPLPGSCRLMVWCQQHSFRARSSLLTEEVWNFVVMLNLLCIQISKKCHWLSRPHPGTGSGQQ